MLPPVLPSSRHTYGPQEPYCISPSRVGGSRHQDHAVARPPYETGLHRATGSTRVTVFGNGTNSNFLLAHSLRRNARASHDRRNATTLFLSEPSDSLDGETGLSIVETTYFGKDMRDPLSEVGDFTGFSGREPQGRARRQVWDDDLSGPQEPIGSRMYLMRSLRLMTPTSLPSLRMGTLRK